MTPKLPRLPFVLLGAMTAFTFGGPLAIGYVLRGGLSPNWPPDRPVEWITFVGISGMVVILMIACLSIGAINRRAMARGTASPKSEGTGAEP